MKGNFNQYYSFGSLKQFVANVLSQYLSLLTVVLTSSQPIKWYTIFKLIFASTFIVDLNLLLITAPDKSNLELFDCFFF